VVLPAIRKKIQPEKASEKLQILYLAIFCRELVFLFVCLVLFFFFFRSNISNPLSSSGSNDMVGSKHCLMLISVIVSWLFLLSLLKHWSGLSLLH